MIKTVDRTSYVLLFVAVLVLAGPISGQTSPCPTPPNLVDVEIRTDIDFDPVSELFTYRYEIFNRPNSDQDVRRFALDFAPPMEEITSPSGWKESFFDDRDTIHWYAFENAPAVEPDPVQVLPGVAQIRPGNSLGGFSFRSPKPPGPVSFYMLGFAPLPPTDEEEAERLLENCPQIAGSFFDLAVQGLTEGPVDFLPVEIDIKPGSDPNSIQRSSRGVLPVAVLSTATLDASQIDPSTVRFGPGLTAPVHRRDHLEDVNADGLTDRVLHFSTGEANFDCEDTSGTLTGTTFEGTPVQGTDALRIVGCGR